MVEITDIDRADGTVNFIFSDPDKKLVETHRQRLIP